MKRTKNKISLLYLVMMAGVVILFIGIVTSGLVGRAGTAYMKGSTAVAGALLAPTLNPMFSGINANTNRSLVQLQYLNPRNLIQVRTTACDSYVDLIQAAASSLSSMDPAVRATRNARIEAAMTSAYQAKCIRPKTQEEMMNPTLRLFWKSRRDRLLDTPQCKKYFGWADDIAFGGWADSDKQYSLAQLFTDAQAKGCSSPQ